MKDSYQGGKGDDIDIFWGGRSAKHPAKKRRTETINNEIYRIRNEIYFSIEVNRLSIQTIIRIITELIEEKKDKYVSHKAGTEKLQIVYIIDSLGGSIAAVLKFVDFLDLTRQKYPFVEFVSIITANVASAGTIMAIVADKRYMTKNAYAMIHELSSQSAGQYTHLKSRMNHYESLHNRLVNIYVQKTGLSIERINELSNKETWFTAEEYLQNNFIDGIK